jgi:membrane protein YdbS with pleckstrin-like domain
MARRGHPRKKRFHLAHFLKVTTVYFILFVAIFGMIDYYAMMVFNFLWFVASAAVLALVAGWVHVKKGRRDHVDEVAEELL